MGSSNTISILQFTVSALLTEFRAFSFQIPTGQPNAGRRFEWLEGGRRKLPPAKDGIRRVRSSPTGGNTPQIESNAGAR
jgi:hypothetical protein